MLIPTEAIGVGGVDAVIRSGALAAYGFKEGHIPGGEVAGTVTAVGDDIDTSWVGRRVWAFTGVGGGYVEQAIAPIGEIERFSHPAALVSLAKLAVKQRESGSSLRGRAQMDRHGRGSLRRLLYMCALVAKRWDPHMRAWAQRLKARGKPTKVVLVAVMRKLLHIIYGVWKHASDYDAQLAFPATT